MPAAHGQQDDPAGRTAGQPGRLGAVQPRARRPLPDSSQPVQEPPRQQALLRGGQPRSRPRLPLHLGDQRPSRLRAPVRTAEPRRRIHRKSTCWTGCRTSCRRALLCRSRRTSSNLVDAYKWAELDDRTGLATYALYSGISDRAEPCESLRASVVYGLGLRAPTVLLSSLQLDRFRRGGDVVQEAHKRGIRGAYFLHASLVLAARECQRWQIVADVERTQAQVVDLLRAARRSRRRRAGRGCGRGGGLRRTRAHRRRRGRIPVRRRGTGDGASLRQRAVQRPARRRLPRPVPGAGGRLRRQRPSLQHCRLRAPRRAAAAPAGEARGDGPARRGAAQRRSAAGTALLRVRAAHLRTPSRRSEPAVEPVLDPAQGRPRRAAAVATKATGATSSRTGRRWRSAFRSSSRTIVAKFVNASTVDGYNPYRITRDGIDWEVEEPGNPWSHIGYWGDHQIIYLLKLLELSRRFHPAGLDELLHRPLFSYRQRALPDPRLRRTRRRPEADHRLRPTLWHERIAGRVAGLGADGKLVLDARRQRLPGQPAGEAAGARCWPSSAISSSTAASGSTPSDPSGTTRTTRWSATESPSSRCATCAAT